MNPKLWMAAAPFTVFCGVMTMFLRHRTSSKNGWGNFGHLGHLVLLVYNMNFRPNTLATKALDPTSMAQISSNTA